MQVVIEQSDSTVEIMTEEEFQKMKDDLDEFDGIHPYIFLGWLTNSRPVEAVVSLQGADTFKIYECEMCGEILEEPGRFCSEECANENAYMYRTCSTCGGEFWDGGTSCTCDDDDEEILEDPTLDPKTNPLE